MRDRCIEFERKTVDLQQIEQELKRKKFMTFTITISFRFAEGRGNISWHLILIFFVQGPQATSGHQTFAPVMYSCPAPSLYMPQQYPYSPMTVSNFPALN